MDFIPDSYNDVRHCVQLHLSGGGNWDCMPEDVASVPFEDLHCVFACPVDVGEEGSDAYLIIRENALLKWNVRPEQICLDALRNSVLQLPACMQNLSELLGEKSDDPMNMFVLSNKEMRYGASAALYPGVLEKIAAKMEDDLLLLPSSVHEFIVMPRRGNDPEAMRTIVREVNRLEVPDNEILSDSVYLYRRGERIFSICRD